MSHEIVAAFAQAGLPLSRTLGEMLDEHFSHRTERRGCGFTQATRVLSVSINQPRDPLQTSDLSVFADWPANATEQLAQRLVTLGWPHGWRRLDEAEQSLIEAVGSSPLLERLRSLMPAIRRIYDGLSLMESRLFVGMMRDMLGGNGAAAPDVLGMPAKAEIGSCSQAEEFFLEIAHARVRRGGQVNVIVGDDGEPLMVEKIRNLGEPHSAVIVSPVRICGVWIPPGGLCALRYVEPSPVGTPTRHGLSIPLSGVAEARFMRLTTLSVPPQIRRRAFSHQVDAQINTNMFSPTVTTIEQLRDFARDEIACTA